MNDIFDQSPAEVRPHVDTNKLMFEAKAELNAFEKSEDSNFEAARSIGSKIKQFADAVGRGGVALAAKKLKIAERQARNFVSLAEAPDNLERDELRAILWGYAPKSGGGSGGGGSSTVNPSHKKLWKCVNGLRNWSKSLCEHCKKINEFGFIEEHLKAIEKKLNEWETEAGL